jgi:hypothetical protein
MLPLLSLHCCESIAWPTDIMGYIKPALLLPFRDLIVFSIVQF